MSAQACVYVRAIMGVMSGAHGCHVSHAWPTDWKYGTAYKAVGDDGDGGKNNVDSLRIGRRSFLICDLIM